MLRHLTHMTENVLTIQQGKDILVSQSIVLCTVLISTKPCAIGPSLVDSLRQSAAAPSENTRDEMDRSQAERYPSRVVKTKGQDEVDTNAGFRERPDRASKECMPKGKAEMQIWRKSGGIDALFVIEWNGMV